MIKSTTGIFFSLVLSFALFLPFVSYAEVTPETVINIFKRLELLENKARELNGENEVLKHQIEQLKKAQKQGFLNVDERIEEMGKSAKASKPADTTKKDAESKSDDARVKIVDSSTPPIAPTAPSTPSATDKKSETTPATTPVEKKEESKTEDAAVKKEVAKTPTPSTPARKKTRAPNGYERETYQAAFSLMKKSPTAATRAFEEYIKMQPESPLAANAQYWIGEIMYSHNNYKGAVQEFIKVLQKYKYSDKAPDAAIKLGYSFYALKNWAYAKRTFEDVVKYFPENKNAVNLAQRRLAKIKAEGH